MRAAFAYIFASRNPFPKPEKKTLKRFLTKETGLKNLEHPLDLWSDKLDLGGAKKNGSPRGTKMDLPKLPGRSLVYLFSSTTRVVNCLEGTNRNSSRRNSNRPTVPGNDANTPKMGPF